jgi:NodT family efflux transporter outer membrane factor (OMF) lipoprotein
MKRIAVSVVALALALAACAPSPPPSPNVPSQWTTSAPGASPATASVARAWWRSFGNDELNELIAQAEAANLDIATAIVRVREARAQAEQAGAALWPTIGAGVSASRGETQVASRGGDGEATTATTRRASASLQAGYELDLFGSNRNAAAAARIRAQSTRYTQEAVRIAVQSTVAANYAQVLAARDRLRLAQERLANAESVLALIETQWRAGAISDLERAQQRSAVASQRASLAGLRIASQQSLNALAVVLGRPPVEATIRGDTLDELALPPVAAGLPATLLTARPDVRASEAQLRAAGFDVSAAEAARLPSLQLTAQGGSSSQALRDVLTPGSFFYSLAASLTAPLFEGGRLAAQQRFAEARRDEAALAYQQSILNALRETEDALVAVSEGGEQYRQSADAAAQAAEASRIAELRYRAGATAFQTVLDAQRTVLQAQDAAVSANLSRYQATIGLIRALGGGWSAGG